MPVKGSIYVKGLKELDEKLRKLEPKIQKKLLKQAAVAALVPVLHAAKAMAPRDTGLLISTLQIKGRARKGGIGATVETKGGSYKGHSFYASFIEFGHHLGKRITRRKKSKRVKGLSKVLQAVNDLRPMIPPQPFMRPAFDQNKEAALKIFAAQLGAGIEKLAKEKA